MITMILIGLAIIATAIMFVAHCVSDGVNINFHICITDKPKQQRVMDALERAGVYVPVKDEGNKAKERDIKT